MIYAPFSDGDNDALPTSGRLSSIDLKDISFGFEDGPIQNYDSPMPKHFRNDFLSA